MGDINDSFLKVLFLIEFGFFEHLLSTKLAKQESIVKLMYVINIASDWLPKFILNASKCRGIDNNIEQRKSLRN